MPASAPSPPAITADGDDLWVLSSNKGLQKVDPATLEVRATYPISQLAELYGPKWKTLWVNDVLGSSLTGSGGTLYLSFDYKDFPGLTAFSPKDGTFHKVDAYTPKEMGTVRFLAAMAKRRPGRRTVSGNPAARDSIAIGTKQGVFFLQLPSEQLGKAVWAGEKLPDAPESPPIPGVRRGHAAARRKGLPLRLRRRQPERLAADRIPGCQPHRLLAFAADRYWVGNSQAAMALPSVVARQFRNSRLPASRHRRLPDLPSRCALPGRHADHAPRRPGGVAPSADMSGAKISTILPLEGGRVLLGGPRGSLALLSADGSTMAAGATPPASFNIQWRNYVDLWRNVSFGLYLKNSLIVCISVMLIAVLMASLGGYALARFKFPGKNAFGYSILATQMIPGIMLLLPVYLMFVNFTQATGIIIKGTYGGLILTYSAYFTPFSIWILRGFFASIPKELEEAALIDGCGPFKAFFRIIIPSAMPGIVATGVYVFLAAWDELMFAWVLTSESTYTIPVGIRFFVGNFQNRYDLMMAAATVSTIPVMIIFFVMQKQIVSGLTAGAVKD